MQSRISHLHVISQGISENHPLFLSLFACVAGCVCCAWGVFPELNTLIHLEPFPDDNVRQPADRRSPNSIPQHHWRSRG